MFSSTPYRPNTSSSQYRQKTEVEQTPLRDHDAQRENDQETETLDMNMNLLEPESPTQVLEDNNSEGKLEDEDEDEYWDKNWGEDDDEDEDELEEGEKIDEDGVLTSTDESKDLEKEEENSLHVPKNEINTHQPAFFFLPPEGDYANPAIVFPELSLLDLKKLVNVLANQLPNIGEDLVIFKTEKNVDVSLTEDRLLTYEILPEDHQFSFKGKVVYNYSIEKLVQFAYDDGVTFSNLESFINYFPHTDGLGKSKTKKNQTQDMLEQINEKLDLLLSKM